jgi:hypothetical protein
MTHDIEETDEQRAQRALVAFKAQLLPLILREEFNGEVHAVITAMLEVSEGLIRRGLREQPDALPAMLFQLDHMCERIVASATGTTAPSGSTH